MPIPGTRHARRLEENVAAAAVTLTAADLARLEQAAPPGAAAGTRYPEAGMKAVGIQACEVEAAGCPASSQSL